MAPDPLKFLLFFSGFFSGPGTECHQRHFRNHPHPDRNPVIPQPRADVEAMAAAMGVRRRKEAHREPEKEGGQTRQRRMATNLPPMGMACQCQMSLPAQGTLPQRRLMDEGKNEFIRANLRQCPLDIGATVGGALRSRRIVDSHNPHLSAGPGLQEATFIFQHRKSMAAHHRTGLLSEGPVLMVSQDGDRSEIPGKRGKDPFEDPCLLLPVVDHVPGDGQNIRGRPFDKLRNGSKAPLSLPGPYMKIGEMQDRQTIQSRIEPLK